MPLKCLINQPHPNHELLSIQKPVLLPINQIPNLREHRRWQPAARPDITDNEVEDHVRGVGWVFLPDFLVICDSSGTVGFCLGRERRDGDQEAFIGGPDAFVAFAFLFGHGALPASAVAFVVFVWVSDQVVVVMIVPG